MVGHFSSMQEVLGSVLLLGRGRDRGNPSSSLLILVFLAEALKIRLPKDKQEKASTSSKCVGTFTWRRKMQRGGTELKTRVPG